MSKHDFKLLCLIAQADKPMALYHCANCWLEIIEAPEAHTVSHDYIPCPGAGIILYNYWGSENGNTPPANLMTKTMLRKERYKLAHNQPVRGAIYIYSRREFIELYSKDEALPLPPLSQRQKAGVERAGLTKKTCTQCQMVFSYEVARVERRRICEGCQVDLTQDEVIEWARSILALPPDTVRILDFETTGLDYGYEAIEIGVLSLSGEVLMEQRLYPKTPITEGATAVNGITMAMLAGMPTFPDVYPKLKKLLFGKKVIAYNAEFEAMILASTCKNHGLKRPAYKSDLGRSKRLEEAYRHKMDRVIEWDCCMEAYSQYVGELYYGEPYRHQPLPGGNHTAIGDCRATLALIKSLAATPKSTEKAKLTRAVVGQ
jgi:DNA polymerase-3 subunit epsilon